MKNIDLTQEDSSVTGYITNLDEEKFLNYLSEHLEKEVIEKLVFWMKSKHIYEFTLLKNIWVDQEQRGQGIGNILLQKFITSSEGPIVLICDNLESQQEGFKLESWYENYGFEATGFNTLSGPVLIRF